MFALIAVAILLCSASAAHAEMITLAIASAVGVELAAGSVAASVATFALTTGVSVGLAARMTVFRRPELRK